MFLYALPATVDWDGCGAPPDGGEYTQVGDTYDARFECDMCRKEANYGHINSQPHMTKLMHYLKITGQTHLLPTTRASLTMQPTPDGFRFVPPPPPGGPMQRDDGPPPPPPTTQEMREMIRMLERKMDQQIQELTTMVEKVRTLEAMVASLAASRSEVSGSAWPPSSWHATTATGWTMAAPSSEVWGSSWLAWHADTTAVASRWGPGAQGEAASSSWRSSPSDAPENTSASWNLSPPWGAHAGAAAGAASSSDPGWT